MHEAYSLEKDKELSKPQSLQRSTFLYVTEGVMVSVWSRALSLLFSPDCFMREIKSRERHEQHVSQKLNWGLFLLLQPIMRLYLSWDVAHPLLATAVIVADVCGINPSLPRESAPRTLTSPPVYIMPVASWVLISASMRDHAVFKKTKQKQICKSVLNVILSELVFKNEFFYFFKRKLIIFQSDIYFVRMSDTIQWFDSQICGFTEDENMHEKQKIFTYSVITRWQYSIL